MQFCLGDLIETNVNMFTDKGMIDASQLSWLPISINKSNNLNFLEYSTENTKMRELIDFDLSRFCEHEIIKNKWRPLSHLNSAEMILTRVKNLFEPTLLVQKIFFDDIGYYLFKIFLIGSTKGSITLILQAV